MCLLLIFFSLWFDPKKQTMSALLEPHGFVHLGDPFLVELISRNYCNDFENWPPLLFLRQHANAGGCSICYEGMISANASIIAVNFSVMICPSL